MTVEQAGFSCLVTGRNDDRRTVNDRQEKWTGAIHWNEAMDWYHLFKKIGGERCRFCNYSAVQFPSDGTAWQGLLVIVKCLNFIR